VCVCVCVGTQTLLGHASPSTDASCADILLQAPTPTMRALAVVASFVDLGYRLTVWLQHAVQYLWNIMSRCTMQCIIRKRELGWRSISRLFNTSIDQLSFTRDITQLLPWALVVLYQIRGGHGAKQTFASVMNES